VAALTRPGAETNAPLPPTLSSTQSGKKRVSTVTANMVFAKS
jgi:hypothetical protein